MKVSLPKRKQAAELQTLAFLKLPPQEFAHLKELHDLFQASQDEQERIEILKACVEIISPDSSELAIEGDLEAGISSETKKKVQNYHKNVGLEIRKRRIEKGWTQAELATRALIPQSHVSRLERGQHTPTHLTIKKIAKALNTQPKMLDPGFDS